jgi:hypothetical protein
VRSEPLTDPRARARWRKAPQARLRSSHASGSKATRKWCLPPWRDGYCEEETYFGRDLRNRLIVYNQKEEILGYLRPNGPGTWRAMILYGGIGWARDGRVARASRGRYFIFSGGRRRGIARGPRALEVAAYRLIYREDCSGWNQ